MTSMWEKALETCGIAIRIDLDRVLLLLLVAAVTVAVYLVCFQGIDKPKLLVQDDQHDLLVFQSCPNPNCVRCQKYRQVNDNARNRLDATVFPADGCSDSAQRIAEAVRQPPRFLRDTNATIQQAVSPVPNQYPNVLFVKGLSAKPFVSDLHRVACEEMEKNYKTILSEYRNAFLATNDWLLNDVPLGRWMALHLLNQGKWNDDLVAEFPRTTKIINSLPDLLAASVFGNAYFSVIQPGTIIEPHCGPTNVRHRLHLTLENNGDDDGGNPVLLVHDAENEIRCQRWETGQAFVFDDSLVHSVEYNPGHEDVDDLPPRIILIVDLWHPELNQAERQLVTELYSEVSF